MDPLWALPTLLLVNAPAPHGLGEGGGGGRALTSGGLLEKENRFLIVILGEGGEGGGKECKGPTPPVRCSIQ